jgi:hypothetical protein
MPRRLSLGLNLGLASVLAWTLLGQPAATPAPAIRLLNIAAATFVDVESSSHNDGSTVCGAFVPSQQPEENKGDLNAKLGSFLHSVALPQGATVRQLTMFANDNSAEDAHVYLVRKKIERGLDPQFKGYLVMAKASTQGAANNVMRRFTDTSIRGARVDNTRFYYFLELVVCDSIEPFAIQIGSEP